MKAIVITEPGGPEVLQLQEVEEPTVLANQVLVKVRATALNRADLLQRRGIYRPAGSQRGDIAGLEFAGEVESVGQLAQKWKSGDRVMGILAGQGYAEKASVSEGMLLSIPDHLSFEEAASIPEAFMTAYDAIFPQLGLKLGESLLVHAIGSGVGIAALQLAKLAGCKVYGTSSSQGKLLQAKKIGLDCGINYKEQDFEEVILSETNDRGVDAILDMVGAPYWDKNMSCLTRAGRLIVVGFMGGAKAQVNLGTILSKRIRIFGTALNPRPLEDKVMLVCDFEKNIIPLFSAGKLKPIVDKIFPLEKADQAHAHMEANSNFGKIVLKVS